ncbi:MAG: MFS transporter [Deltaproteobacteria bacterium]|nr:MFS transporter [Deltaproteobacteria bacterium]
MSDAATSESKGGLDGIKQYLLDFKVLGQNPKEFWVIQGVNFLDSLAYFSMIAVITLFLTSDRVGFNPTTGGYVVTAFTTFITVAYFFSGFITDSLGIKKSLVISQSINIVARFGILGAVLMGVPYAEWIVVALLLVSAPGMAMTGTVFQAANKRFSTVKSRSASFNVWYLIMNLGAVAGGFAVDIIRKTLQVDTTWIFLLGAISATIATLAAAALIHREDQVRDQDEEAAEEVENTEPVVKKSGFQIFKDLIKETSFWRFIVLMTALLGVRAVFTYMYLLMPLYWVRVIEDLTGEPTNQGFLQALNPILIVVGLILFIPIANKFNVFKMLVFGAIISSFSLLAMVLPWQIYTPVARMFGLVGEGTPELLMAQSYFVMSAVMLIILSVGEVIWSPKLTEYTAAIAPEGQEGSYLGLSVMPWFVAKLAVSAISGHMLIRWVPEGIGARILAGEVPFWERPEAMWLILFVWAIVGPLLAIAFRKWLTEGADLEAKA